MHTKEEEGGLPFILRRRQYPIRPAFAMTINKSQGQTFKNSKSCHLLTLTRLRKWPALRCAFPCRRPHPHYDSMCSKTTTNTNHKPRALPCFKACRLEVCVAPGLAKCVWWRRGGHVATVRTPRKRPVCSVLAPLSQTSPPPSPYVCAQTTSTIRMDKHPDISLPILHQAEAEGDALRVKSSLYELGRPSRPSSCLNTNSHTHTHPPFTIHHNTHNT